MNENEEIALPSGGSAIAYIQIDNSDNNSTKYYKVTINRAAPSDTTAPTVSSVSVPANGTYKSGDTLEFTVNFDENVTVTGTPIIPLIIGSTTKYASYVSGTGLSALVFRYTVTNIDNDSDGIAVSSAIDLDTIGTIKDAAGNDAVLTLNSVGSTSSILIDNVGPMISSINNPTDKTYKAGDTLDFKFYYNENVYVVTSGGTPRIELVIGSTTRYANYVSGTGTNLITFRYTVQNNDSDGNGLAVNSTIKLNGGTIKDSAGNNAQILFVDYPLANVLVDAVAPAIPSAPDLIDASDTGSSNSDNNTNDDTPTFTGTAEAGSTVKLYDGATEIGSAVATGGTWTITSSTLSGGDHSITAKAFDLAGNVSTASTALTVTIDAVAPAIPSAPDLINASDTGSSNSDNKTKDNTPTFTGTAEAGSTVKLCYGATEIGSAVATGGTWTITSSALSDGNYYITAKATDAAGNTSNASDFLMVTIDTTPPTRNDVTDGQIFAAPISFLSLGGTAELKKGTDTPVSYTGGIISDNGSYVLSITDTAGNTYSVSFIIAIPTVPGIPQNLSATPGNGQAVITFDPPSDDGGSIISIYVLKFTRVSNNSVKMFYINSNSYTVPSLINGEEYKFSIAAGNIAGIGTYSNEVIVLIGRDDKAITSTSAGTLSGGNIINVPYGTTVGTLKSGINVSDGAAVEIITGTGGTAVTDQGTTNAASTMKVRVTAENGTSSEYSITVSSQTFNVTYNGNGSTGGAVPTDSKKYVQGDSVTLLSNTGNLTKTGYTFAGWSKTPTGSAITSYTMGLANVTLYAVWTANTKYSVTYNGNGNAGGTVPTDSNVYASGATITLAGNTGSLTKTGYTFAGWSTSPAGSAIGSHIMVTANATFYAVWTADSAPANTPSTDSGSSSSSSSSSSSASTSKKEPFLEENGGTGKTITDKLEAAKGDKPVEIDMNGSTTVQSAWLETIAGKDIDMVLDMGNGITWTINGKSITGTDFSDIDLEVITNSNKIPVDVINNVTGEKNVMQLTFKHEGSLGFTATLTIDLDKKNKGLIANLYYYNEDTKQLEFQGSSEIRDDGTADLDFPHFSSYAVVIDKVSLAPEDVAVGAGVEADGILINSESKEATVTMIAVSLLTLVLAVVFIRQRKKNKFMK